MDLPAAQSFGATPEGVPVHRWVLDDGTLRVCVLDLGATVQALEVPDRDGRRADVVLGFDDPAGYLARPSTYAGAVIGRYANRIGGAAFELDGRRYQLSANDRGNTLHGGAEGFDRRIWQVEPVGPLALRCRLLSPDGDQGFPGELRVEVVYRLRPGGVLQVDSAAVADVPTVVNLTQHSYFALDGLDAPVGGQSLQVHAERYLPVREDGIPTGDPVEVAGTPFDLRSPRTLAGLVADLAAAGHPGGVDHHFVAGDPLPADRTRPLATLTAPASGRRLELHSSEPGLQVYTATGMHGDWIGKSGRPILPGSATALEPQHPPNTPNHPLHPPLPTPYQSRTTYHFGLTPR